MMLFENDFYHFYEELFNLNDEFAENTLKTSRDTKVTDLNNMNEELIFLRKFSAKRKTQSRLEIYYKPMKMPTSPLKTNTKQRKMLKKSAEFFLKRVETASFAF
jgi:hypothetical protein